MNGRTLSVGKRGSGSSGAAEQILRILMVDDEDIVHETLSDYLYQLGHEVGDAKNGIEALSLVEANDYDLALLDVQMPGMDGLTLLTRLQQSHPQMPVVIITGHGNMEMAIQALRSGAADFLTKPIKLLELDAVIEKAWRIRTFRENEQRLREALGFIQGEGKLGDQKVRFVGKSKATDEVRRHINLAAEAACDTILIFGETGTGKEVVARELHCRASSKKDPFIAVSCPALPESLVESELFGHAKGSFTGATESRAGCFELAHRGTLFLDDIGDLAIPAQAKLLRVLETRTVRRVGGSREERVDVRVIASTNVNLESLVEKGRFRRDLLFRLNVFTINLAPLRKRRQDILPLAEHFLMLNARARGTQFSGFSKEAEALLTEWDYPGNARQLRNVVERAAIVRGAGLIEREDLSIGQQVETKSMTPTPIASADNERERIVTALEKTKWNRKMAAKELDMAYSTLRYKIIKLHID